MKKILLTLATAATITPAFGAARIPNYSSIDLSGKVSNGLIHGNMICADIDNDGVMELIAKGRDLAAGWAITIKALHLDADTKQFTTSSDIADPDGQSWERIVYTIDYNNDGNIDLLIANSYDSQLLKGDGKGNFEKVEAFKLEGEISIQDNDQEKWYAGVLGVADFNGDGYQDIVTFCGNPRDDQGTPVIFFNDGGKGTFIKDENTGIEAHRGGTLCVGDYNADGAVDILVNGWAGDNDHTYIWKNDGSGKFTKVDVGEKSGTEKGQSFFVDVTGNGLLDVFITGESCPNSWEKAAYLYKNNGDDTFTKMENGLPGCSVGGGDWCDLNSDGLIDLVYVGDGLTSGAVFALNEGDGKFTAYTDKLSRHRGGAVALAFDFNNNDVVDIALMGYNDDDANNKSFMCYNGYGTRLTNKAPNAPTGLTATADGNKTVFTWEAGSDEKHTQGSGFTPAEALRYNYFVKTTDGQIITAVPADTETGKLRSSNVNAASAARTVTLNIASDKIASWGVQSIDGAKAASAFAVAGTSGIDSILSEADANAPVEYFNIQGVRVANPQNGLYIRRQGTKVDKIYIK